MVAKLPISVPPQVWGFAPEQQQWVTFAPFAFAPPAVALPPLPAESSPAAAAGHAFLQNLQRTASESRAPKDPSHESRHETSSSQNVAAKDTSKQPLLSADAKKPPAATPRAVAPASSEEIDTIVFLADDGEVCSTRREEIFVCCPALRPLWSNSQLLSDKRVRLPGYGQLAVVLLLKIIKRKDLCGGKMAAQGIFADSTLAVQEAALSLACQWGCMLGVDRLRCAIVRHILEHADARPSLETLTIIREYSSSQRKYSQLLRAFITRAPRNTIPKSVAEDIVHHRFVKKASKVANLLRRAFRRRRWADGGLDMLPSELREVRKWAFDEC